MLKEQPVAIDLPILGGCFCGYVKCQISEVPSSVGICHCESCRRIAGAESVGWAVMNKEALAFTHGTARGFRSSESVERTFCDRCGTTLRYHRNGRKLIDVTLATLDNSELLQPTNEAWCAERVSWNQLNETLEHFEGSSSGWNRLWAENGPTEHSDGAKSNVCFEAQFQLG